MPSGTRIRSNSEFGLTTDAPLTAGATSFNSARLALMPVVSSAHAIVTLDPRAINGEPEIVVMTAHTAAATVATITRAAYGTVARSHPAGTEWIHAPVDEDFIEILTSVTRPSDPYRGQMIFETDTNRFTARTTSDTWVNAIPMGAWDTPSPAPALTQGVAVSYTQQTSRVVRVGRIVHWNTRYAITSAGTIGQALAATLPIPALVASAYSIGSAWIYSSSNTTGYVCQALCGNGTTTEFFYDGVNASGNAWGTIPNIAISIGSSLFISVVYEAAA